VADVSNTLAMQYLQQDSFAAALHLLKKAEALAGRHKALALTPSPALAPALTLTGP